MPSEAPKVAMGEDYCGQDGMGSEGLLLGQDRGSSTVAMTDLGS